MPTPSILDFDALLAPMPGANPAGVRLQLLDQNKLKELREDVDPETLVAEAESIQDMSARRTQLAEISNMKRKKPQWAELIDFSKKYLTRSGKDLYLAVTITEALTILHGFAGLRDGLRLIRRLLEEAWDRLYPEIDPDDYESLEARCTVLATIMVVDSKPYFPNTIRAVPILLREQKPPISTADCLPKLVFRREEPPLISQEEFENAIKEMKPEDLSLVNLWIEDLQEAQTELKAIDKILDQRAGKLAPSVRDLNKAIEDVLFRQSAITYQETAKVADNSGTATASNGVAQPQTVGNSGAGGYHGSSGGNGGGTILAAIASREDAYARLEELAGLLEKFDPHSPVPFLIRRALEMRTMRFPELVDALTRDARVMDFLRNPLGSTPVPPAE